MIRSLDKYSGVRSCTLDNKQYIIPALIAGAAALGGALINRASQRDTNKENAEINQRNLDYQAAMTREQWERDNTVHQREVADLEAAGLSPLANTTGSPVTSAKDAPSPIAMQAPQIDMNSVINASLQAKQLEETERHNKVLEGQKETELSQNAEKIKQAADQLKLDNKKVEAQIKYQADLIENQAKQIEETIRSNKANEDLKKCSYESEQYWKEIDSQTGGKCPSFDIYDFDIYVIHKKLWDLEYKNFVESLGSTSSSSGKSDSQNLSGGFGLNAPTGPGGNINAAEGTSHSEYKFENKQHSIEASLDQWYKSHPMPVYHMYKRKN